MPRWRQQRIVCIWERLIQKVVYFRRLDGRAKKDSIYVSKSHLVSLVPLWRERYPKAKFITIVRDPAAVFLSWRGLQDAGSQVIANYRIPHEAANQWNMHQWKTLYSNTMKFLKDKDDAFVVFFKQFIENPEDTLGKIYEFMELPYQSSLFSKSLNSHRKHKSSYRETLEDFGMTADQIYAQLPEWCEWLEKLGWTKPSPEISRNKT